jgi:pimeloyl-ACP methyl ester carboxylesterase
MTHDHVTAPTQFVEANGIRFAYRRFGAETGVPLLFMQHYRGGMDHWDPTLTDGFARDRPVILFDNAGVAGSSGETPGTIDAMADHAWEFVDALGVPHFDLLGFSIGGYVAQAFTARHPGLVRRLMLVGTGPRGGEPPTDPNYMPYATATDPETGEGTLEAFLYLFFSQSERGQAAGRAFWDRRHRRQDDVDPPSSAQTMKAQSAAVAEWRQPRRDGFAGLESITSPTLVVNGSRDVMIPTVNAYTLAQHIPNAQLIIYPDAGHASQFQYPELFLAHARMFLDAEEPWR